MNTNENNPIHAVATTDGQLVVLADNFGFHVVLAPMVIDFLHQFLIARSQLFAHYGRTNNNRVMIDTDPTEFGYPANLTRLAQHFAPELWARFVDKTNKPGILEQL